MDVKIIIKQDLEEMSPLEWLRAETLWVDPRYFGIKIVVDGKVAFEAIKCEQGTLYADGYGKLIEFLDALDAPQVHVHCPSGTVRVLGDPESVAGVRAATRAGAIVQRLYDERAAILNTSSDPKPSVAVEMGLLHQIKQEMEAS